MTAACKKTQDHQTEPEIILSDSVKTVLFVCNSLTYTNDLPKLVAAIGKDSGIEIKTTMSAYPNYALEDHWNDGLIQLLIATKKYDFIVVQQGPSSQQDGRKMLMDYGKRTKTLFNQHNAQLAFFMVWPDYYSFYNFDGVIKNYTDAAAATNSLLCPVGKFLKDYFVNRGLFLLRA